MNRSLSGVAAAMIALLLAGVATAQSSPKPGNDQFKKESAVLANSIDEVVNTTIPGYGLLQRTKAAYLEGYGVIFTLEVAFEPPRNPFSSPKSPAEIRTAVTQRQKDLREKLSEWIKQKAQTMNSIGPGESVAVVTYLFNSNPADLPNMPASMTISVKKQDVLDLQAGKITPAEFSARILIREL